MKKITLLAILLVSTFYLNAQQVTTAAGYIQGYADGSAVPAKFNQPFGMAFNAVGDMYVADYNNHRIRKITKEGIVSTFAGSEGGYADGTGTAAQFAYPSGVATDIIGNVYVTDSWNNRIRKITPEGVVTTFAGSTQGYADGIGTAALFSSLSGGIAIDIDGNIYVIDSTRIRKITPEGVVTTLAGSTNGSTDGAGTDAKFGYGEKGLTIDTSGNIFVADSVNHRIRKITPAGIVSTFAGSTEGYADGIGTAAKFYYPSGIATDVAGNIYVADKVNVRIRKITPEGLVSTLAGYNQGYADGTGTAAKFNNIKRIVTDVEGNIYISDDDMIRKVTPEGMVTTISGYIAGYADGGSIVAKFEGPKSLATDVNGNMYVADSGNHRIRKITPKGVVSTFAGSISGYSDGTGTTARFDFPGAVATDTAGNVYVADTSNDKIRKITPEGLVSTLAGSTGGYVDGIGTTAKFENPQGIATDIFGNVYVADTGNHRIRKITPEGVVSTLAGSTSGYADGTGTAAQFYYPIGLVLDALGNVYVADSGTGRIRKITPAGVVSTFAGPTTGLGTDEQLGPPFGITIDNSGNVYMTDFSHRIRKITSTGVVTTLAGSTEGFADGTGTAAKFSYPGGITIDNEGNICVVDSGNNRIRKIIMKQSTLTFETNGGSSISDMLVFDATGINLPDNPTKQSYIFAGWFNDAELTVLFNFYAGITANKTIYARWIPGATLTFNTNGGTAINSITVAYGTSITTPANPTKQGYNFTGWYSDIALTAPFNFGLGITVDTTIYAKWEVVEYTLTFETNGGNAINLTTVAYENPIIPPVNPTKLGYDFAGWYINPELTILFNFDAGITADTTIYAKWSVSTLGLNDLGYKDSVFIISPNPCRDLLKIQSFNQNSYSYKLFDMTGKKVLSGNSNDITKSGIDTSSLKKGVYMLYITADGKTQNIKVAKE